MIKYAIIIVLCLVSISLRAQCIKGNCINGKGTYDYGWCIYEGEFKESKADGVGTMKYSDYTYKGQFKNGVEDGPGEIIYTDGRKESVFYYAGRKSVGPDKIAKEDYKPLEGSDKSCISGNCVDGFGTYVFESGNKYSGNFKNKKREGQGTAYFVDGDKFEGTWKDDEKVNGVYTFKSGAKYIGNYDSNGKEINGKLFTNGIEIPIVDGVAHVPPQKPTITYVYVKSDRKSGPDGNKEAKPICWDCKGTGKTHETFMWSDATRVNQYGNREFGQYNRCSKCNGTGHLN